MKTVKEKNMAVAKAFIMFLKKCNAFVGYRRATYAKENRASFSWFLKNQEEIDESKLETKWRGFIFNSFVWADTVEYKKGRVSYWSVLHNDWIKILETLKRNDYEISEDISRAILSRSD
jgi:hypothetical protein